MIISWLPSNHALSGIIRSAGDPLPDGIQGTAVAEGPAPLKDLDDGKITICGKLWKPQK